MVQGVSLTGGTLHLRRLVAVVAAAAVLAGTASCASSLHLPRVSVTFEANRRDSITIASHGSGIGLAATVLRFPDGHRKLWGCTLLQDGAGGGTAFDWFKDLHPGGYRYFVYAEATRATKYLQFPARDLVAKNLIASGNFTVGR